MQFLTYAVYHIHGKINSGHLQRKNSAMGHKKRRRLTARDAAFRMVTGKGGVYMGNREFSELLRRAERGERAVLTRFVEGHVYELSLIHI